MKTLEIQVPAEGILQTNDWGNSKVYRVACNCHDDTCNHNVWIEADDHDIIVTIYTTGKTNFWSKTRWYHIWTLLTKGYIDTESSVHLTRQQALNYSETLKSAILDVEKFNAERKEKSAVVKLAEQGDCE
jgi:hypothetical protein